MKVVAINEKGLATCVAELFTVYGHGANALW